ncbi:potassium channel protein [Thermoplasma volcanium GSS1]|uniref:Potassium channel protein n=1 Tax=Thermoplasma volcanium (strain ATCC 51530 / DSM 4299 / JCM 9571 / NBRC 15438 / GSS1) TaxID=273116 RepID=Q97CH1_THEVO|nr:aldo/keto reductase [Thermoplasma volcanium]BAB59272.1 potassium channel protein [Thermoplasma volcanium GSS1]
MKYVRYGSTASFVSVLSFGAMTFGERNRWKLGGVTQELSDRMVKRAYDAGINLFDTADVYDDGDSEVMLGRSLKPYRDSVMIATKVRGKIGQGVNSSGLSRHHMHIAIKKSLERLGTEWIDIYQYHGWDVYGNFEEFLETMESFVEQGLVIYPAVSNFTAWQISVLQTMAIERGYARYESAQMNYSLLNRDVEYEVLPFMKYSGMTLLSWSPLHGGVLAGKYKKGEKPATGTRMGNRGFFFPYFDEDHGWDVVEEVKKVAQEQGCKPSQVALAWIISKSHVAILGARSMEQLEENLGSLDVQLTKEQMDRLDNVSKNREIYPNWMVERQNHERDFEIIN